jgi:purine-nucleoside phosphorylase
MTTDTTTSSTSSTRHTTETHRIDATLQWLAARTTFRPEVAVVLGSGLGAVADHVQVQFAVPFADVPHMPRSTVAGHSGRLVLGHWEGVPLVMLQGRVHLYEGLRPHDVVFAVRMAIRMGARTVVLTNASGGIHAAFGVGEWMLIEDHINLTGANCLTGPNEDALGVRFPDMTQVYDPECRLQVRHAAQQAGVTLHEGVYAGVLGPSYETPAEIRMLRTLGADAVGMSTVLEAIAARHMGARVVGLSCITDVAAGLAPKGASQVITHEEVQQVAVQATSSFLKFFPRALSAMRGAQGRS